MEQGAGNCEPRRSIDRKYEWACAVILSEELEIARKTNVIPSQRIRASSGFRWYRPLPFRRKVGIASAAGGVTATLKLSRRHDFTHARFVSSYSSVNVVGDGTIYEVPKEEFEKGLEDALSMSSFFLQGTDGKTGT